MVPVSSDQPDGTFVDEVLAAFTSSDRPSAPRSAVEVAAALDASTPETTTALAELADRGELASRTVPSGHRVWWRPPPTRREAGAAPEPGRDELLRLDRVNATVRRVLRAVVAADTREALERRVCEVLADADLYRFTVSGRFSSGRDEFERHAVAGSPGNYLERVLEDEDRPPLSEGIGAAAARTGDLQFVRRLDEDRHEFWREMAARSGVGSYAAVPLVHDAVVHGVLGVYAVHPDAFGPAEREVLAELGEIVGYAVDALERTSVREPATELVFASETLARPFAEAATGDEPITVDVESVVPLPDGSQLQYWDVAGLPAAAAVSVLGTSRTARDARLVSTVEGTHRVELHCTPDSVAATLDAFDGRLESVVVADGEFRATMLFEGGVDAESVARGVREAYPSLELASSRRVLTETYLRRVVAETLTERQATVLRVAHAGGYFRQPRESTGAELADGLDVTKQTFHYHLRRAEERVFDALLDSDER